MKSVDLWAIPLAMAGTMLSTTELSYHKADGKLGVYLEVPG